MTTVLILVVFMISFFVGSVSGSYEMLSCYENDDVQEHYAEVEAQFELMPSLTEIGHPDGVEYYDYFSSAFGIFTCDSDVLICRYDDANYAEQKSLLDDRYVFQTEWMTAYEYDCEPAVEIDGYQFRTLSVEEVYEKGIYYPKRLIFIATNDTKNELVYIAFYNDDLDYIESLGDFINVDCGWRHIR